MLRPIIGPLVNAPLRKVGEAGVGGRPPVSYIKVATFGDSTSDAKGFSTTGYLDQSVADRQTTGATQNVQMPTSKWMLTRFYPAAQLEYNGGISGQSTQAMLDRSAAASGPARKSIEDVVAMNPDLIIARCGSINDISSFTTATTQATIDGVFTRHMQIINGLAAGDAYVLDEGIAGYDASGGVAPSAPNLAFIRAAVIELNTRISAAIQALGNRKIRFLSPVGVTCDESGAFLPNCTTAGDGTHLTNYAQARVAQAQAAIMPGWIGPSTATPFTGTNLIEADAAYPSPVSVAFGTAPNTTNFTWQVSSGTRQNASIESINGVNYAVCEMAATGAGSFLAFYANLVPLLITPARVAANDVVTIEADVIAEAVTGTLGANAMVARLQLGVSSTDRIIYDNTTSLSPGSATELTASGRVSFGKVKIPTSVATLTTANTFVYFRVDGVNGSTCRLKVGNIRIVKQ